jgi:hypothetical protein
MDPMGLESLEGDLTNQQDGTTQHQTQEHTNRTAREPRRRQQQQQQSKRKHISGAEGQMSM